MNNQAETIKPKKTNTGKIGFILALIIVIVSLLFIPLQLFCLWIILLPAVLVSYIVSLFFCIHGLFKNRNRKLAVTGLFLDICTIILLFFVFITFTPPGSIPPPLNTYKFKRACPEAAFWLDFDKYHVMTIKSQYTVILNKFGAVSFSTKDEPYQPETIIEYAEKNGWKYFCSFPLRQEDFEKFDAKTPDMEIKDEDPLFEVMDLLYQSPIIFKKDCIVLVFETDSPLGYPSYAFISNIISEEDSLVVFYQNPVLPDSYTDYWFSICADLAKNRSEEMELNP